MNDALARRARQYAQRTGRTFTEVVEQAVTQLIVRPPGKRRKKRIVLPTYGSGGIVDDLTLKQAIQQTQLEDDLRSLGLDRHDDARR
jgi:hypothetical protein